jgi:hypothetical protein
MPFSAAAIAGKFQFFSLSWRWRLETFWLSAAAAENIINCLRQRRRRLDFFRKHQRRRRLSRTAYISNYIRKQRMAVALETVAVQT